MRINLSNIFLSGIKKSNNNNVDENNENSLNDLSISLKKNIIVDENQSNYSSYLSSVESDSNSCNNISPLFDDKFLHNKENKPINFFYISEKKGFINYKILNILKVNFVFKIKFRPIKAKMITKN